MAKRKAKLGLPAKTPWDMKWLGELPRSESEIQYALARLSNPVDRIIERFFWPAVARVAIPKKCVGPVSSKTFEGLDGQTAAKILGYEYEEGGVERIDAENLAAVSFRLNLFGTSEPPDDPFALHDFVLYRLMAFALTHPIFGEWKTGNPFPETQPDVAWDPKIALRTYIRHMVQILSSHEYWEVLLTADNESGFEPRSTARDVVKAKGQILHLLSLDMLESNFYEHAYSPDRVLQSLFSELSHRPPGRIESSVKEQILSHFLAFFSTRISREVAEINGKFLCNVKRENYQAESNRPICYQAIGYFDEKVMPLLAVLPLKEEDSYSMKVECANALFAIATAFTWADEFEEALSLLQRAVHLAAGTHIASRIEERIVETRQNIESSKVFAGLAPVAEAPYLDNHEKFYGGSDQQPITLPDGTVEESYITTHYFCFFGIPLFPKKRYRVVYKGDGRYRVLGSLPLSNQNKAHIAAVVMLVVLFLGYVASTSGDGTRETLSPPPPPYAAPRATPAAPAPSRDVTRESGNVSWSERDAMRSEVESEKARLREMESGLVALQGQIESLKAELDTDQTRMNILEATDQVEEFNDLVPAYNAKLTRIKRLITEYKNTYELYEFNLNALNVKIEEYNARISRGR